MLVCNGNHYNRLFVGEGPFLGVKFFLEKHSREHPSLGFSVVATELSPIGGDNCPECKFNFLSPEEENYLYLQQLFDETVTGSVFWGERCRPIHERIEGLRERGVTVITGYDATKIHEHEKTRGKRFHKIHWICPHDRSSFSRSDYEEKGLPKLIHNFFASASRRQEPGDKIYVVLAQPNEPFDKGPFYQGVIYNIVKAAKAEGYSLYAKRPFGPARYPGYIHAMTGEERSAAGAERQREFVFIKGLPPQGRGASHIRSKSFSVGNSGNRRTREYYQRDTDNESSECDETISDTRMEVEEEEKKEPPRIMDNPQIREVFSEIGNRISEVTRGLSELEVEQFAEALAKTVDKVFKELFPDHEEDADDESSEL